MVEPTSAPPVLASTRVVEFGHYISAPLVGMLLADQGAKVVKVERPGGDPARVIPGFAVWNRGKQSIVLDLKTSPGRDAARELVRGADVVVENFTPGTASRLGISYEDAMSVNRDVVYCSLPAFGRHHPRRDDAAGESVMHGLVGFLTNVAHSDAIPDTNERPYSTELPVASTLAAITAVGAITAALFVRSRVGAGQHIEVPLHAAAFRALGIRAARVEGMPRQPRYVLPLVHRYRCADGRYIQPHGTFAHFARILMEVAGHPEWGDSAAADLIDCASSERRDEWRRRLEDVFVQRPSWEWEELISQSGGAAGVCRSIEEWTQNVHASRSGLIVKIDNTRVGETLQPGVAVKLSRTPGRVESGAPVLGQHSAEPFTSEPTRPATGFDGVSTTGLQGMLSGVKVLDLSIILAGPTCGRILAEFGADVIKIDDPNRLRPDPFLSVDVNCGKRSVLLDLKTDAGREVFWRLAAACDVLVENYREGALEELGLGYEQIATRNPGLVYASLSTFGTGGPWSGWHGWEQVAEAVTGMQVARAPENSPPMAFPFPICDYATGGLLAYGVLLALVERQRTGVGQRVTTSLVHAATLFESGSVVDCRHRAREHALEERGAVALAQIYRAADGWIVLETRREESWIGLIRLPEFASLAAADSFASAELRERNKVMLAAEVSKIVEKQPRQYWLDTCRAAGVGVAERFVLDDVLQDPVTRISGLITEEQVPGVGNVQHCGTADVDASPMPKRGGLPMTQLGGHWQEVLTELGYSRDALDALLRCGAVVAPARQVNSGSSA